MNEVTNLDNRHAWQSHRDANGKKVFCLDPARKEVEVVHKNFKVLIRFDSDGSATVTNFGIDGKPISKSCYPSAITP